MANSVIKTNVSRDMFDAQAGTQTYIIIHSKTQFEEFCFNNEYRKKAIVFSNWDDVPVFPSNYGSGIILPCYDATWRKIIYFGADDTLYICDAHHKNGTVTYTWKKVTTTDV